MKNTETTANVILITGTKKKFVNIMISSWIPWVMEHFNAIYLNLSTFLSFSFVYIFRLFFFQYFYSLLKCFIIVYGSAFK